MQTVRWHAVHDVAGGAVSRVLAAARQAVTGRGEFHLVLAGGNTPRELYRRLAKMQLDLSAWHVWFGDERCLPPDDPERNSQMVLQAWPALGELPASRLHVIAAERGALVAAADYAAQLADIGDFDLVLLGLGEDGHTASLFPGQDWEVANTPVLAVSHAPKPPPERVSLSAGRLSQAREVLFLVAGGGKRAAVAAWQAGEPLPAAAIQPVDGVDVLIDLS